MIMPLLGTICAIESMYLANVIPGLGHSHSSSKQDKIACPSQYLLVFGLQLVWIPVACNLCRPTDRLWL
jgi:hypothetical protein